MNELSLVLMVWISSVTGLSMPDELPVIQFKERCAIYEEMNRECPRITLGRGVAGTAQGNVITLLHDWKGDNPRDIAILVHELTHVMQYHNQFPTAPCLNATWEKQAYAVHFHFLESMGLDPYEVTSSDETHIKIYTSCLH